MDNIKIKDNIKVPDNLDDYILRGIDEGEKLNNLKRKNKPKLKPLKTATIVSIISVATITTACAVNQIIDYFEFNNKSRFEYEEKDLLTYSKAINLSKKDNGIEFKIDTISADDGFLNITYTIISDKKITDIDKIYERPFVANPNIKILINGDLVNFNGGFNFGLNSEATFASDYELKGILREPISGIDINKDTKLTVDFDEIFGQKGDWKIDIKLDKKSTTNNSKKYIVNKTQNIIKPEQYYYSHDNNEVLYKDAKVNLSIDNVTLSPFGSLITITEKSSTEINKIPVCIGDIFVLRDDKGNYLDIIGNKSYKSNILNVPVTNTYEFIRTDDNIKSLTLIPFIYRGGFDEILAPKSINSLPATFEISKYGKVTIEDISITEDYITYTYKKDGAIPYDIHLNFFDKDGEEIMIGGMIDDFVDRENNIHTVRQELRQNKYKNMAKKITSVSVYKDNKIQLLEDQKIDFKLSK